MQSDSQADDSNPLNDLNKELEMLQKERLRAIDSCEFSRAKAIDVHIERLKERISMAEDSSRKIQNVLQFELKKEEIQLAAIREQTKARQKIFEKRDEFQKRQTTLHRIHTNALTQVAEGYSAALEIESLRLNPISETMVRQAKLNAKVKKYEVAEALFNESNMIREQSTLKRQDEVDQSFEIKKAQLDQKHKRELDLCAEKERTEINEIFESYQKFIKKCRNILLKTAYDLQLQVQPEDISFLDELTLDDTEILINSPSKTSTTSRSSTTNSPRTPTKSPRTPIRSPKSQQITPLSLRERTVPMTKSSASKNSAKKLPKNTLSPRSQYATSPSPLK